MSDRDLIEIGFTAGNDGVLRKGTAYHEASHAVIGRVLTLPCGGQISSAITRR